jgi:hypothetical protein
MAPLLSYYATHDTAIKFAMASLIYSENPIEGMYISLNTILISEYYSIYHVYLFHILYILCRNNLAISHIALEARSIEIHFTTKRILDFSERIEMFIENCDQFFNKLMMASIEQNAYTYINNKLIYK